MNWRKSWAAALRMIWTKVDSVVIHGNDLTKAMAEDGILSDDLQGARLARWLSKKEVVFARTTPAQKLIIVEEHQEMGHIVAVIE